MKYTRKLEWVPLTKYVTEVWVFFFYDVHMQIYSCPSDLNVKHKQKSQQSSINRSLRAQPGGSKLS